MGTEIERKFLVDDSILPLLQGGLEMRQGYLADNPQLSVRVRLAGELAWLTVKGRGRGITRPEFEYPIPPTEAREMLGQLVEGGLISKTRYRLPHKGVVWEIDVFAGDNAGLIVAEVELESEQQALDLPAWVAEEVSNDPRYLNVNLASHPFSAWEVAH